MFLNASPQGNDGLENPDEGLTCSLTCWAFLDILRASLNALGLYFDSRKRQFFECMTQVIAGCDEPSISSLSV